MCNLKALKLIYLLLFYKHSKLLPNTVWLAKFKITVFCGVNRARITQIG